MPPFSRRFLLAAAVLVIPVSLLPEPIYGPLNRAVAFLVGHVLMLVTHPVVRGTRLSVNGFDVRIIAECSGIHLIALYAAFLVAAPAPRRQKWIGFGTGAALLCCLNVLRIAIVSLTGSRFPAAFDVVHIYLGQMGMILAVVLLCLEWWRWVSDSEGRNGPRVFFVRFLTFSILPFFLWVSLHKLYLGMIDAMLRGVFRLATYRLFIPESTHLTYQTFSVVTTVGLLMAVKGIGWVQRLRWIGFGMTALTLLQVLDRLCYVWISALKITWMLPAAQVLHVIFVYAFPLMVVLQCLSKIRSGQVPVMPRCTFSAGESN